MAEVRPKIDGTGATEGATDGKDKRNTRTGTTKDTGAGAGTSTGNKAGAETTEKVVSKLATVKEENTETVPTPTPKKTPRKRKKLKQNSKNSGTFNAEQITALLMTSSSILGNNEAGKIFALSENECKQIAEPLSNILANSESLKGLSEHSDSIALVTACFMIFVPKIIMFIQYKKIKKLEKSKQIKIIKGGSDNDRKTGTSANSSTKNVDNATGNHANNGESILAELPSLA